VQRPFFSAQTINMVDVIIVNYNQPRELAECAASVQRQQYVRSLRVRNTGQPAALPGILCENGANVGYGAACNEQARKGTGKYLLFLNADVVLSPDALVQTAAMMERCPWAGLCGIAMEGQAVRMKFPTCAQLMARSVSRRRSYAHAEQSASGAADWVLGAFLLVRREAFEAVGGFDESFFLYFEEVDLARRMASAGWNCLYCADTAIQHRQGSSAPKPFSVEQYARSRLRYAKKHFALPSVMLLRLVMVTAEPWARLVQTGSVRCALAPLRGLK